jgi:hypothetical protein
MMTFRTTALCVAMVALCASAPLVAAERIAMPLGAFLCKSIEPVIEHAKLVRQPTTDGLRPFVESAVQRGECRQMRSETAVEIVDVDKRGFALVEDGGRWWTDAENLWGYFDTPAKIKAWTKP